MIVIGADTHKRSHTLAAVDAATGRVVAAANGAARRARVRGSAAAGRAGSAASGCGRSRTAGMSRARWSASCSRAASASCGCAPKLMAGARSSARERGKSDAIDAVAIARAALREGIDTLPVAQLGRAELDVRLLRRPSRRLVAQRTALINDLRWHLHDLWPELEIPPRALIASLAGRTASRGRLARAEQTARVRIARDELRRIRELTRADRRARARARRARRRARAAAARRARLRRADRGQADRRDRRRRAASRTDAKLARTAGVGTDPRLIRAHPTATAWTAAATASSTARCTASPSPRAAGPRHRRLPRPQTGRRQDPPRSAALPQAPPRPPRLATAATRPPNPPPPATRDHDPLQHPASPSP